MEARPERPPRCLRCDYDLTGSGDAGACPECGQRFDLADAATFHRGRPMSPWARRWVRPLGWPAAVAWAAVWVWLSWALADPMFTYFRAGAILTTLFTIVVVLPILALRTATREGVAKYHGRVADEFGRDRPRSWRVVAAFLALAASATVALPTRAWFLAFLPWMNAVADEAAGLPSRHEPGYAGPIRRQVGPWTVYAEASGDLDGSVVLHTWRPRGDSGFLRTPRPTMPGYNEGSDGRLTPRRWHYFAAD